MIELKRVENQVMVSTVDLYDLLRNDPKKYYNWIHHKILQNQILRTPTDYFLFRKKNSKPAQRTEFYVTITVAQYLCLSERTNVARRVLDTIEEKVARNQSAPPKKKNVAKSLDQFIFP